jgi:hypothetical protein
VVSPGSARAGDTTGEDLFAWVQRLAERTYPPTQGRGIPPSGARIFYITCLALRRQDPQAVIAPDANLVLPPLAQRFRALAPDIARHLATDFKRAVRLLDQKQSPAEARRLLRSHALRTAPSLTWASEHLEGIAEPLRQLWQTLWSACWQQAEAAHLKRLRLRLLEEFLLVTPVAGASAKRKAALKLLRQQLEDDNTYRPWRIPPAAAHLYEEPLTEWVLRPLLSGTWLMRLCQALAELARAVPELVRGRAAALEANSGTARQQPTDANKPEPRRRIPPWPHGNVTAEAIFYYTVSAYRAALPAGDHLILPDERLLSPAQFRTLLALAVKAAEHLLWDDSLAVHALPPQTPERRSLLRQALLPPRLRKHHEDLTSKERRRRTLAQAAPLPAWEGWETGLEATLDLIDRSLANSTIPAAITSANLASLLGQPRAALVGQYPYQAALGAWLRAALPGTLPGGDDLLEYCQELAQALGAWPPDTPGAPDSVEQAGRAIFWHCKLTLENAISPSGSPASKPPSNASNQPTEPPRRADGGLVVWLGKEALSPEALELATVVAPLVARVIYESSWEAARQGKPLFVARLKAGESACVHEITRKLTQRARDRSHANLADTVLAAWDKFNHQLERLLLPSEVTHLMLSGDRKSLQALDFLDDTWYTKNRSGYQFLGSITSFACSFIRPTRASARLADEFPGEQEEVEVAEEAETPDDTLAEDATALRVLAMIVQAAQGWSVSPPVGTLPPQEAKLLVQGLFTNNTGRLLVDKLARQSEPIALELLRIWQTLLPPEQGTQPAIIP